MWMRKTSTLAAAAIKQNSGADLRHTLLLVSYLRSDYTRFAMTLTLLSWNVNGARAIHRAGFLNWLAEASPDILCLQETRAEEGQLPPDLVRPPGYFGYWTHSTRKKGHSGTAILTRREPARITAGIGNPEFDDEGRTVVADFERFILINCYFPNGGRDHERVPYKLRFYDAFLEFCNGLRDHGRSLIICGDVNTSHREIDLARPKQNLQSTGIPARGAGVAGPLDRCRLCRLIPSPLPGGCGRVHVVAPVGPGP